MRFRLYICLLYMNAFVCFNSFGQKQDEYEVKAVFLYNFTQFVQWPEEVFKDDTSPFIIGVLGTDVFGEALKEVVAGEKYKNRPIEVHEYHDLASAGGSHILFIPRAYGDASRVTKHFTGKPVLIVGDHDNFMKQSGMLRLYIVQSKIRIEINQQRAVDHKLDISSKLLRLANIYKAK
jgi:YfiR/HmsC-like